MDDEISKNDLVELNSGGPPMKVTDLQDGMASCSWHDDDWQLVTHTFPVECLRKLHFPVN